MGDEYSILSENRMRPTTLFLAWQDKRERRWFPVGRLDADGGRSQYVFRYTHGAGIAKRDSGFAPLYDFPRLEDVYESRRLFPLFENRVMNRGRRSFETTSSSWPSRTPTRTHWRSWRLTGDAE